MNVRPAACRVAALVALALAMAEPGSATEPYTLTHDVRVRIDARLQLMGFGEGRPAHQAFLEAEEGQDLVFSHGFEIGSEVLEVEVLMRPRVDQTAGLCRVALDVEVRPPDAEPTRVEQSLSLDPGRVRLVEAWSGTRMNERLVLAFTATWEKIPRVRLLREGAEPVAIVLEVVERDRVLQRHEFGAVVGESSRFMVRHTPGEALSASEDARREVGVALEFLPKSIAGGKLDLSVGLVIESEEEESPPDEAFRLDLREELSPGLSLILPLPESAGGGDSTHIRVTPWF